MNADGSPWNQVIQPETQGLHLAITIASQSWFHSYLWCEIESFLKRHVPVGTSRIVPSHFEPKRLAGRKVSRRDLENHVAEQITGLVGHGGVERQFRTIPTRH